MDSGAVIKVSPKDPRGKAELREVVVMKNIEAGLRAMFDIFVHEQGTSERGTLARLGADHEFLFKVDVASNQVGAVIGKAGKGAHGG